MLSENVVDRKCAVCGTVNTLIEVTNNDKSEFHDLDSRPEEPYRSTMENWVQACSNCMYCSESIEEAKPGARALVSDEDYSKQFRSSLYPALANKFICQGIIDERIGRYPKAGWAYLHAAWVCDDRKHEAARELRLRAVSCFEQAMMKGERIIDERGGPGVMIIDVLRRAKDFERARDYVEIGKRKEEDEMITRLIRFEELLIKNKDTVRHTVQEALKAKVR